MGPTRCARPSALRRSCRQAAVRAARSAISLHGGVGYLGEYPIEALLRDAIGLSLYEGTTQIQKLILGRELLGVPAFW